MEGYQIFCIGWSDGKNLITNYQNKSYTLAEVIQFWDQFDKMLKCCQITSAVVQDQEKFNS